MAHGEPNPQILGLLTLLPGLHATNESSEGESHARQRVCVVNEPSSLPKHYLPVALPPFSTLWPTPFPTSQLSLVETEYSSQLQEPQGCHGLRDFKTEDGTKTGP